LIWPKENEITGTEEANLAELVDVDPGGARRDRQRERLAAGEQRPPRSGQVNCRMTTTGVKPAVRDSSAHASPRFKASDRLGFAGTPGAWDQGPAAILT
jgi:hypothetical protein